MIFAMYKIKYNAHLVFFVNMPIYSLAPRKYVEILVNLEKFPEGFALGKFIQILSYFHIFPRGGGNIWAYSLKNQISITNFDIFKVIAFFWESFQFCYFYEFFFHLILSVSKPTPDFIYSPARTLKSSLVIYPDF